MNRLLLLVPSLILSFGLNAYATSTPAELNSLFVQQVKGAFGSSVVNDHAGFVLDVLNDNGTIDLHLSSNADRQFYPASSIKILIAVTALAKMHHQNMTLDSTILWPGHGQVALREVIRQMLAWSDNDASNAGIVWDTRESLAYAAKLLQFRAELPVRLTRLLNGFNDPHPPNRASAQGLADIYFALATGKNIGTDGLGLEASDMNFLRQVLTIVTEHNDYAFGAGFSDLPYMNGVKVYHKPGYTSTSTSDAGFFRLPDGRLVVLTIMQDFASKPNLKAYALTAARFLHDHYPATH